MEIFNGICLSFFQIVLWFWNVQVSLTIVYHSILFNDKIAKNRFLNKMRKEFNMSWISNEGKHFSIDFFLLLFSQDLCFLVFSGLFPKTPFKICYFLVLIQLFMKGKKINWYANKKLVCWIFYVSSFSFEFVIFSIECPWGLCWKFFWSRIGRGSFMKSGTLGTFEATIYWN